MLGKIWSGVQKKKICLEKGNIKATPRGEHEWLRWLFLMASGEEGSAAYSHLKWLLKKAFCAKFCFEVALSQTKAPYDDADLSLWGD